MVTIVDDIRERISLCGMSPAQFFQLVATIRLARQHHNPLVSAMATELHLSSHWILAERPGWPVTITLCHLTWEQVFVLTAVVTELVAAKGPRRQRTLTGDILDALTVAVESALRTEGSFGTHGLQL